MLQTYVFKLFLTLVGCILIVGLFSLVLNAFPWATLLDCKDFFFLYCQTDETQLYLSRKLNYSATSFSLHNYLCAIKDWKLANLLKLNSNKMQSGCASFWLFHRLCVSFCYNSRSYIWSASQSGFLYYYHKLIKSCFFQLTNGLKSEIITFL